MSSRDASKPFNLIYEAEWNDIPCFDYPLTPETWVQESIRPLVNTQVDTLLYNLCSSDGYCCALDSGQILMDNFPKVENAWVWRYRENTKRLIAAGANPPDLAVRYGHGLGLKVIPIVRMNDFHDNFFKYEVSAFKLANPHLLIGHGKGYMDWEKGGIGHPRNTTLDGLTWSMFDFAHQEVRDHKLAIIKEFITRWDNDGISLDFERTPWFFQEEGNANDAALMTNLVREVRKVLNDVARTRKRKQYLHVRVGPDLNISQRRGLDIPTWINEGLVDAISPGAGYLSVSLDLQPWRELIAGRDCWLYPCINHWKASEVTRAWAKTMYARGADGLHLFNYGHLLHGFKASESPQSDRIGSVTFDELHPSYYEVLNQIADRRTFKYKNSTYSVESVSRELLPSWQGLLYRQMAGINSIELPITLAVGRHSFLMPFAEDLSSARLYGYSPQLTLRLMIRNYTYPDQFDVTVNDFALDNSSRTTRAKSIMEDDTWIEYPVHDIPWNTDTNRITIDMQALNPQMRDAPVLHNAELIVRYDTNSGTL